MRCHYCDFDNVAGAMVCKNCGRRLTDTEPRIDLSSLPRSAPLPSIECPSCGWTLTPDMRYCDHCGKPVEPLIKCPYCQADVFSQSKFCSHCGRPISTPPSTGPFGQPRLRIVSNNVVIRLPEKDSPIIVGRSDTERGLIADIDLTAYDAKRLGVSRYHCKLYCQDGTWKIEDLLSVNFTEVNGQRVLPGEACVVHHNDEIRLGDLRVQFLIDPLDKASQ